MQNITIALESRENMAAFLAPKFRLTTDFYHSSFGDQVAKNFDVYMVFDESFGSPLTPAHLDNKATIGMFRYPKSMQATILNELEIETPNTITTLKSEGRRNDIIYALLKDKRYGEKFVCKPENGARGIGGILLNVDEIYSIIEDAKNEDISNDEFFEKWKVGGAFHSPLEYDFVRDSFKKHDFIIQEKKDIKKEFRVIYGYDCTPIVYERKIDSTKSWQSNTSIIGKGTLYEGEEWPDVNHYIKNMFDNKISLFGEKMFSKFRTPFFCADVYLTTGNEVGILEFQMNMGYQEIPKTKLVELVQNGTTNLLKKMNIIDNE